MADNEAAPVIVADEPAQAEAIAAPAAAEPAAAETAVEVATATNGTAEASTSAAATNGADTAPDAAASSTAAATDAALPASEPAAAAPSSTPAPDAAATAAAATAAATAAADDASRKRRSRWAPAAPTSAAPAAAGEELDEHGQPKKKSRWSSQPAAAVDPLAHLVAALTPEQIEAFKVQMRIDELTRGILNPVDALREYEAQRESTGRARSPSPEPLYDGNGVRTNTRPLRFVVRLEKERQNLIETLQRLNPQYKPPAGYRKIRYERRLHIPIKEYPDYNFIGMIIGPRGNTQKRMEKESGCKIVIRGRGSQREGRANNTRPSPGDDDELHVLIAGDDEAKVIATTKEVEKLLVPIDETKNEHKARQLRELAVINGTLRDEIICRLCGGPGHRQIECPQRNQSWQPANVRCNICGSDLHPAQDCPQRFHRTADQAAREMNDEYSSFMQELSGDGAVPTRSAQTMYLTDGGQGGGGASGGGGGSGGAAPAGGHAAFFPPGSGGGGGDAHPRVVPGDRPTGGAGGGFNPHAGGSRIVKGVDPRETFREFRPAHNPSQQLHNSMPIISARDGFANAAPVHLDQRYPHQQQQQQYPPQQHYPPQQGYGQQYGHYPQQYPQWNGPPQHQQQPYGQQPPPQRGVVPGERPGYGGRPPQGQYNQAPPPPGY